MITKAVYERVVHITCGETFGTGFVLDHEDQQYLITARHVVKSGAALELRVRGKVVSVELTPLVVPNSEADVAVFRLDRAITPPDHPLAAGGKDMVYGQDAYFLGFPFGLTFELEDGYFPLVKRCTISATNRGYQGREVLLLDGWNNPGFSGGPVVFRPPFTSAGYREPMRVAGIIHGYAPFPQNLTVQGRTLLGAEVAMNSGIIIAEQIEHATEAIEASTR